MDSSVICGGTLIHNNKTIITAAQCVFNPTDDLVMPNDRFMVQLGMNKLMVEVVKIIVHPGYNSLTMVNDIAIIILANPISYSDLIQPACLWEPEMSNDFNSRTGSVHNSNHDCLLSMDMVDLSSCNAKNQFDQIQFCAKYRNDDRNFCNEDTGNGFFVKVGGVWFLRGVASSTDDDDDCEDNGHILFSDLHKWLVWIFYECSNM